MIAAAGHGISAAALQSLAVAGREVAGATDLDAALAALATAAASGTGATFAVIRVADPTRASLRAQGVWASSAALRAELEGSQVPVDAVGADELTEQDQLPEPLARLVDRAGATAVLVCPVTADGLPAATLELGRSGEPFSGGDTLLARLVANHAALLVRAAQSPAGTDGERRRTSLLDVAGRALAAV
ncbi:MAG: hypothetical protein M3310_08205, partial [Actinomycetota bacterium]|nr:hypothetical protein [Actinomycetota bacterium]